MNNKTKKAAKIISNAIKVTTLVAAGASVAACRMYVDVETLVQVPAPKQSDQINFGENGNLSATVQGNFTDNDWQDVLVNIEAALMAGLGQWANPFNLAFAKERDLHIILVETTRFGKYHTSVGGDIIYINSAILNDADALEEAVIAATRRIGGNPNFPDIVKVTPSVREAVRMANGHA
ncbi:MAG: hypothetical protein FWC97_07300 [Treponema sp.]|nr:hypothetical protein [Treponema sp.]